MGSFSSKSDQKYQVYFQDNINSIYKNIYVYGNHNNINCFHYVQYVYSDGRIEEFFMKDCDIWMKFRYTGIEKIHPSFLKFLRKIKM